MTADKPLAVRVAEMMGWECFVTDGGICVVEWPPGHKVGPGHYSHTAFDPENDPRDARLVWDHMLAHGYSWQVDAGRGGWSGPDVHVSIWQGTIRVGWHQCKSLDAAICLAALEAVKLGAEPDANRPAPQHPKE